ncbi:Cof-type HAD-IIB family hydrolase [Staphylococcus intermedius]|uniref:Cof-type HAD-IIB family hydrolase n=1 Tax=Staphylococcus intermedius TaxID=1285 RepID=UPI000BBB71A8|nr:Cof-type HAD-IIB family hydrolase [Staphylococcus intermedius]PCF86338.1 hydrolase [Staphylococcus intermedius]
MNLQCVVTDMDGIFLDSRSQFDREAFRRLKGRCEEKGIRFAFCTGKQCDRVVKILNGLERDAYIVGDSATRIQFNGDNIWSQTFDRQLGLLPIQRLQQIDLAQTIIACTEKSAYVLNQINESERQIVHGSYETVTYINKFDEIQEDFLKITVHDPKQQCFEHVEKIKDFEEQLYIVASEAAWIDITAKDVDKGKTIQRLQQLLGCSQDSTIAFGDGLNDVALFNAAGIKVAMDNAYPELKRKADLIARDNNHNGVIHTLNVLLDLER